MQYRDIEMLPDIRAEQMLLIIYIVSFFVKITKLSFDVKDYFPNQRPPFRAYYVRAWVLKRIRDLEDDASAGSIHSLFVSRQTIYLV